MLFLKSYSQNLEDLIIDNFLEKKKYGFYIDVGAHYNKRLNNTYFFHKYRKWKGINIEPNSQIFSKINGSRKKDIYLNIGISDQNSKINFYQFNPDTVSTFSEKDANEYKKKFELKSINKINVKKLKDLFLEYNINNIDLLNIDTEGLEMQVIKGNDWKKFRPKIVCIEHNNPNQFGLKTEIVSFFKNKNYKQLFQNEINIIFYNND